MSSFLGCEGSCDPSVRYIMGMRLQTLRVSYHTKHLTLMKDFRLSRI